MLNQSRSMLGNDKQLPHLAVNYLWVAITSHIKKFRGVTRHTPVTLLRSYSRQNDKLNPANSL